MYAFLRGELAQATPPHIILDVHGVGYQLLVPLSLFGQLPAVGAQMLLYTSFIVRETSHQLYGFANPQERNLFEQLTAVSGVGPKLSLSLISHLAPSALHEALMQGNWAAIAKTPGVGKKTAERLIIELRGKVQLAEGVLEGPAGDAINALINLGYHTQAARQAVDRALKSHPTDDVSTLIAAALKK